NDARSGRQRCCDPTYLNSPDGAYDTKVLGNDEVRLQSCEEVDVDAIRLPALGQRATYRLIDLSAAHLCRIDDRRPHTRPVGGPCGIVALVGPAHDVVPEAESKEDLCRSRHK